PSELLTCVPPQCTDPGISDGDRCGRNAICAAGTCVCEPGWTGLTGYPIPSCLPAAVFVPPPPPPGSECWRNADCADHDVCLIREEDGPPGTCVSDCTTSEQPDMCAAADFSPVCVNFDTDESHCGGCDRVCDWGLVCEDGQCVPPACSPGET